MKIIENRGCDIRYEVFEGTPRKCRKWLENHGCRPWNELYPYPCGETDDWMFFRRDEEGLYVNGDGEPFEYRLTEWSYDTY